MIGNPSPSAKPTPVLRRLTTLTPQTHGIELALAECDHRGVLRLPHAPSDMLTDRFPEAIGAVARTEPASRDAPAPARIANSATIRLDRQERERAQTRDSVDLVTLADNPVIAPLAVEPGGRKRNLFQLLANTHSDNPRTCNPSSAAAPLVVDNPAIESVDSLSDVTLSAVEPAGLRECQRLLAVTAREPPTLRMGTYSIHPVAGRRLPSSKFPAPAPSFKGGTVELGGLQESAAILSASPAAPQSRAQMEHAILALGTSMCIRLNIVWPSALVSTIVWTLPATHLACILRGELAPCLAWEREGIGTAHVMS
ncbi:hypothetical protein C8R47DRAFT_1127710 [Mycena vitilis]|nr:hypothetical protein C8R47DRAFT_1127710 [Mycena vitilis]